MQMKMFSKTQKLSVELLGCTISIKCYIIVIVKYNEDMTINHRPTTFKRRIDLLQSFLDKIINYHHP